MVPSKGPQDVESEEEHPSPALLRSVPATDARARETRTFRGACGHPITSRSRGLLAELAETSLLTQSLEIYVSAPNTSPMVKVVDRGTL